jgi:hypothetical protein
MGEMRNGGDEVNPSDVQSQHPLPHGGLDGSRYIKDDNSHGQNGLCWKDGAKCDAPERMQKNTFWDKGKAAPGADIEIERCGSMEMISTGLAGGAIKGDTTDRRGGIFAKRLSIPNGTSKDERSRHSMRRPRSLAVMSTTVTELSAEDYIDASLSPQELSSLDTLKWL